jgi:ABC-type lipoprotein release transport system permease subunit
MDREQLITNFRLERIQSVSAKLVNPADADRVIAAIADDKRISLHAERETDYYARHTQTANAIQGMGMLISIIIAIGATFGAVNTLYAAVASRGREIGTLRALGFSRRSVLVSFILEGIILSSAGGLIGCILGIFSSVISFKLPEQAVGMISVHPEISAGLLFGSFVFSVMMGALGAIFPALQAARMEITQALRRV